MTFDRRSLLMTSAALAALQACKVDPPKASDAGVVVDIDKTIAAIAFRLLPDDELGPGARTARVDRYLQKAMNDPRLAHVAPMLKRGASFIDRAAQAERQKPFIDLDGAAQDDLIGRLANNKMRPSDFQGPVFIRFVLALTLEGFFGDPKHGGNDGEVAWKWIHFSPHGRAHLVQMGPK